MAEMKSKTEDYWKQKLTPEQYQIVRQKGTEMPFSGIYLDNKTQGMYRCVACGQELFSSDTKFDSGTGWPSFTDPANRQHVELLPDLSHGMARVEVKCSNCGAHLGNVFNDGPGASGQRYCINSVALNFDPRG
jgi:peptide-methionine (R)-S-oxide reductase